MTNDLFAVCVSCVTPRLSHYTIFPAGGFSPSLINTDGLFATFFLLAFPAGAVPPSPLKGGDGFGGKERYKQNKAARNKGRRGEGRMPDFLRWAPRLAKSCACRDSIGHCFLLVGCSFAWMRKDRRKALSALISVYASCGTSKMHHVSQDGMWRNGHKRLHLSRLRKGLFPVWEGTGIPHSASARAVRRDWPFSMKNHSASEVHNAE